MRGQLKLVICGTARKLTVTFLGVRSLPQSCTRVRSHPSYLYLKISLFPDNENRVRHKTTPRTLTSDSLSVHESFSFNISRRDISKRILISAWSKSDVFDRSSFIGCMSFGVKRIVANQEVIQGWYYFLSETLGRKKHLTGKVINESEYSDYECHDRGQLRVQTLPRKVISEPENTRNQTTLQRNLPTNNARCSRMPIRNKRSCDNESNPTKRMRLAEDVHTTVRNNELGETERIARSRESSRAEVDSRVSCDVITGRRNLLGKKYSSTDLLLFHMSHYGNHEEDGSSESEEEKFCETGLQVHYKETKSAKIIQRNPIREQVAEINSDFVQGNLVEKRCSARVAKRKKVNHVPNRRCVSSYEESHPEEIIIKIAKKLDSYSVNEVIEESHEDRGYHSGATSVVTSSDSSSDESKPKSEGDYVYLSNDPNQLPWDSVAELKVAEIKKCGATAPVVGSKPMTEKGKQNSIQNLKNWFNRKHDDIVSNVNDKPPQSPKTINPPKSLSTGWLLKYKAAENHVFRQLKRSTSLRKTEAKTCEHCVYSSQTLAEVLKRKASASAFRSFLQSEFSDENILFYLDVETYKQSKGSRRHKVALKIYEQYLMEGAANEVNIDAKTRNATKSGLSSPCSTTFDQAQDVIFRLMETDSFRRFQITEFRKCKCSSRA